MGFVDEIYEMYKDHLSTNDEDAVMLVLNLLNNFERKEILEKIKEMEDYEVYQMFTIYLIEALKARITERDDESLTPSKKDIDTRYH